MNSEKTLRLVAQIYEAASDPRAWGNFLRTFTEVGGGTVAALFRHDEKNHHYDVMAFHGVPDYYIKLYLDQYAQEDEWIKGGQGILRTGWVGVGQSLCAETKLVKTKFYSDLLQRYDIFHQCGGIVQETASARSAITLLRPRRKGSFGDSTTRLLAALMPHLQQAMKLHQQFMELNARSRSLEAAIDLLVVGIIFLNHKGEPILLNRKAEDLVRRKDGIFIADKRLCAMTARDSSMLTAAVAAAAQTGIGSGLGAGGSFLLRRERGRPLSVTVAPLRNVVIGYSQTPAAVLFISDPDQGVELPADFLQRCYSLTAAEARLTMILLEGHSLKEAADLCGVTQNTAKTQLKSVFSRTYVQRQSELVRLLLTGACQLRGSSSAVI